MTLTGKDKRALKARGQTMKDDAQLGTAGITETFVKHVNEMLVRKELVKLRFGDTDLKGAERHALAAEVCAAVGAECVAVLGRTMLLYRPNPALEPKKRALGG